MKNVLYLGIAILLVSCSQQAEPTAVSADGKTYYGAEITAENAVELKDFANEFASNESDSMFTKVQGEVASVCKKKGCWMTMAVSESEDLFIKFKDYDFFVPLNCEGKVATIEGWAYKEEVSVEELKHYAFDEGKSEEEINAITEPEVTYTFMADGVVLE